MKSFAMLGTPGHPLSGGIGLSWPGYGRERVVTTPRPIADAGFPVDVRSVPVRAEPFLDPLI